MQTDWIYLDNASTTRIDDEIFAEMLPYLKDFYGNPSSIHQLGVASKVLLEDARDLIAEFIGAKPKEIFFVSSGTEANNFALKGSAFNFLDKRKDHIITSAIEHSAVLDTVNYLRERFGFDVTFIKPNESGLIDPQKVLSKVTDKTFLLSFMHSNNETGNITDIKNISDSLTDNVYLHSDTVQSFGKINLNVKDLNVNFAVISSHKIYGPKGIAALYIKDKTSVDKFIHGGMQERDMRGGTENIPAIAGFKKAVEILKNRMEEDIQHYLVLKSYLVHELKDEFEEGIIFNTDLKNSLPNILNLSLNPEKLSFDEEMLLINLDLKGIAVSGGSACTSGTNQPSHVITEIGRDKKTALASIRISFGRDNKKSDVDRLIKSLKEIVK